MIEIKQKKVLRHVSGLYLSWERDSMPHTRKISDARQFYDTAQIAEFLLNSYYKPDKPEDYEIVDVTITYRIEEEINHDDSQSGAEESKTAPRD